VFLCAFKRLVISYCYSTIATILEVVQLSDYLSFTEYLECL